MNSREGAKRRAPLLVADRAEQTAGDVVAYFGARGIAAESARTRAQALAALEGPERIGVLVDLWLDDAHRADGLDVISEARRRFPRVPILAFSPVTDGLHAQNARKNGADLVLRKPLSLHRVEAIVRDLVALRGDAGR